MLDLKEYLNPVSESILDDEDTIMDAGAQVVVWDWLEKTSNFKDREAIKKYVKIDGNYIDIDGTTSLEVDIKKTPIPPGYFIRNVQGSYIVEIIGAQNDNDINNYIPQNTRDRCSVKVKKCKMRDIHFKSLSCHAFAFNSVSSKGDGQIIHFAPDTTIKRLYSNSKSVSNLPKTVNGISLPLETIKNMLVETGVLAPDCELGIMD